MEEVTVSPWQKRERCGAFSQKHKKEPRGLASCHKQNDKLHRAFQFQSTTQSRSSGVGFLLTRDKLKSAAITSPD